MDTMTKQDVTMITESAKNRIIERLVTKYDVQSVCDGARDRVLAVMQGLHVENQALLRQSNANQDQVWRRTAALETQVNSLQAEIRSLHQAINRLASTKV